VFSSRERLPHLLPPSSYRCADQHRDEAAALFLRGWHVVGTLDDVPRPGDFFTADLFGHPVQVRNFGGEARAFSNVCAHRHCLLTSLPRGRSDRMRCQYHGWEYGQDGRTRFIPEPKNFAPFEAGRERLRPYRLSTCGRLMFVAPADEAPDLRDYLGDFFDVCAGRFSDRRQTLALDPEYPANWKVPVENSLEAYHVPCIHPTTFRADPGEARSTHVLGTRATSFRTDLPFSPHSRLDALYQRFEGCVLRSLGCETTGTYEQHHVFPNLLFSFTDAISLVHCVLPTGPRTSRGVVRQFGLPAGRGGTRRRLGRGWDRVAAAVTRRILEEDMALYPAIQGGLDASENAGVLGRCEERIHAFQAFVREAHAGAPGRAGVHTGGAR
jgi:phenylpropionate dioxygenase-like ring-hydroxylating dioxygenase large terminal subunit